MKIPSWSYVIGILMMFFGGCDMLSSSQSTILSDSLEVHGNFEQSYSSSIELNVDSLINDSTELSVDRQHAQEATERMRQTVGEVLTISDFTRDWIVRFGFIGIFVYLFYIIAGLFLMIPKAFSIKLVYGALILSILFSIIQTLVLSSDSMIGIMTLTTGFSAIFSVIIDVILIIVIACSDKSVYDQYLRRDEEYDFQR